MTRKILIIISIILILYIIFRIIETNQILLFLKKSSSTSESENFFPFTPLFNTPENELNQIAITDTGSGISSIPITKANLPLREYCVKSSYNTAFSGSYMNLETIKYVLSRGCRFVDFEVYMIDNIPCIAYTTDPTYTNITAQNPIPLIEAFKILSYHGFSSPTPNMNDPLFIQLRIQSKYLSDDSTNNNDIYKSISIVIENSLKNRLYKGKVNGDTILNKILGKIIIIIDKIIAPDYNVLPICDAKDKKTPCYNLSNYVNIESGGDNLRSYTFGNLLDQLTTPPYVRDNKISSSITQLKLVSPEQISNSKNPVYYDFIANYGVQFIAEQFYKKDLELELYEKFFSDNLSAFVAMNVAIPYTNKMLNTYSFI